MTKLFRILGAVLTVFAVAQFSQPAMAQTYVRRYATHITSATTVTVTSSTAWVAYYAISVNSATGATVVIKNKEGTAKALFTSPSVSAAAFYQGGSGNKDNAVVMTSGIDITTTGTINCDVFLVYYL